MIDAEAYCLKHINGTYYVGGWHFSKNFNFKFLFMTLRNAEESLNRLQEHKDYKDKIKIVKFRIKEENMNNVIAILNKHNIKVINGKIAKADVKKVVKIIAAAKKRTAATDKDGQFNLNISEDESESVEESIITALKKAGIKAEYSDGNYKRSVWTFNADHKLILEEVQKLLPEYEVSNLYYFPEEYKNRGKASASSEFPELKDKSMTEEELIDFLNNSYYFDEMIDESHWNDENFVKKAYEDLQNIIKEYNITITKEGPNVEDELHNLYENAEKGLSSLKATASAFLTGKRLVSKRDFVNKNPRDTREPFNIKNGDTGFPMETRNSGWPSPYYVLLNGAFTTRIGYANEKEILEDWGIGGDSKTVTINFHTDISKHETDNVLDKFKKLGVELNDESHSGSTWHYITPKYTEDYENILMQRMQSICDDADIKEPGIEVSNIESK